MPKNFIDITPVISERLGVFPGDVRFQRRVSMDFDRGDHLALSSIETTLHLGAHTDAPNHYAAGAAGIAARDLTLYMGRCLVLQARAPRGARVTRAHLGADWQTNTTWPAERILVRTDSFPDPENWNGDFNSLDPSLIQTWGQAGVRLVGLDTPSIDPETAKILESHHMVARFDLAILEGVVLADVPEGLYSLVALPLKIENADAAPVRAVLFRDPDLFSHSGT